MLVRRETPADADAIDRVHRAAFEGDEPVEVALVRRLRAAGAALPRLSLVAEHGGTVIGHVCTSRARVDGTPVLALGPIGVLPDVQRSGAGSALMHAVVGAADALDEILIGLLGHLEYYPRFGFVQAISVGIEPDESSWTSHFQVRTLTAWNSGITGTFRYPDEFYTLRVDRRR